MEDDKPEEEQLQGMSKLNHYGRVFGVILLVSIVLFILTGLSNSVLAGYLHGVVYHYFNRERIQDPLQLGK